MAKSITLDNSQWHRQLCLELHKLQKESLLCDVELLCDDGQRFSVHSCVLAAASSTLRSMFLAYDSKGVDSDSSFTIHLPNLPSATLATIILYLYVGNVHCSETEFQSLRLAAEQMDIKELTKVCKLTNIDSISSKTCLTPDQEMLETSVSQLSQPLPETSPVEGSSHISQTESLVEPRICPNLNQPETQVELPIKSTVQPEQMLDHSYSSDMDEDILLLEDKCELKENANNTIVDKCELKENADMIINKCAIEENASNTIVELEESETGTRPADNQNQGQFPEIISIQLLDTATEFNQTIPFEFSLKNVGDTVTKACEIVDDVYHSTVQHSNTNSQVDQNYIEFTSIGDGVNVTPGSLEKKGNLTGISLITGEPRNIVLEAAASAGLDILQGSDEAGTDSNFIQTSTSYGEGHFYTQNVDSSVSLLKEEQDNLVYVTEPMNYRFHSEFKQPVESYAVSEFQAVNYEPSNERINFGASKQAINFDNSSKEIQVVNSESSNEAINFGTSNEKVQIVKYDPSNETNHFGTSNENIQLVNYEPNNERINFGTSNEQIQVVNYEPTNEMINFGTSKQAINFDNSIKEIQFVNYEPSNEMVNFSTSSKQAVKFEQNNDTINFDLNKPAIKFDHGDPSSHFVQNHPLPEARQFDGQHIPLEVEDNAHMQNTVVVDGKAMENTVVVDGNTIVLQGSDGQEMSDESIQFFQTLFSEDDPAEQSEPHHRCEECGKAFATPAFLKSHLRSHSERRPFSCDLCGQSFKHQQNLIGHMHRHGEKHFVCDDCPKGFYTKSELVTHRRCHTGEKPFVCSICNKAFAQRTNLTSHERSTHHDIVSGGVRDFECPNCQKKFKTKQSLRIHEQSHTRTFSCQLCPAVFETRPKFKKHMKDVHGELDGLSVEEAGKDCFECFICQKPFPTLYRLKVHQAMVHEKAQRFKCDHPGCEFYAFFKSKLDRHKASHEQEEWEPKQKQGASSNSKVQERAVRFVCPSCGDTFHSKVKFQRHQETHETQGTGSPPEKKQAKLKLTDEHLEANCHMIDGKLFECLECQAVLTTKHGFMIHLETHQPASCRETFPCSVCAREFYHLSHLNRHMKEVHTKEKRFRCQALVCDFSCFHFYDLVKHYKRKHSNLSIPSDKNQFYIEQVSEDGSVL